VVPTGAPTESSNVAFACRKAICDWLEENEIKGAYSEQVVDEARRLLAMAEQDGRLPPHKAPPTTPLAEIIQRLEPPPSTNSDISFVGRFAAWLARWT
jgi:hypothetical protein